VLADGTRNTDTPRLGETLVAGGIDEAAAMLLDERIDELAM